MTNTKFRKRALLSSVAMLLVALVALGSATFAWFVANPEVTASGVIAQTKADSGIRIASDTALNAVPSGTADLTAYAETTNMYQTKFSLLPSSPKLDTIATFTIGDSAWYEAVAEEASASAKNSADPVAILAADKITTGASTVGKVYYEDVWIYSDDNSVVQALSVSLNAATGVAQGLKVAVVAYNPAATGTKESLVGVWAADTTENATTGTYNATAKDFSTAYDPALKADQAVASVNITTNNSTRSSNGTTPAARIRVYVYLDGAHTNVYSNAATTAADLCAAAKSIEIKMSTNSTISWS